MYFLSNEIKESYVSHLALFPTGLQLFELTEEWTCSHLRGEASVPLRATFLARAFFAGCLPLRISDSSDQSLCWQSQSLLLQCFLMSCVSAASVHWLHITGNP